MSVQPSVVYREGPLTVVDYDEAIEALRCARRQVAEIADGKGWDGCSVCGDSHSAEQCHHNPLILAREGARKRHEFRCYHCGFVTSSDAEAVEHFGGSEDEVARCIAKRAEPV